MNNGSGSDPVKTGDMHDTRRSVLAIVSSSGARIVARLLLIAFVVKLYGLKSFGYLGEVAAIVELSAAFAGFGLPKSLLSYLDTEKSDPQATGYLMSNAIALTALVGLLMSFFLTIFWPYIFPKISGIPSYIGIAIILIATTEILLTITRSRRLIRWDALAKGVIKPWSFLVFAALGYFLFVRENGSDATTALFAAYAGSLGLTFLFALCGLANVLRLDGFHPPLPGWSDMIRLGKRTFSAAIVDTCSFAFRRADIIILGLLAGPAATGIYYLAQQIATIVEKMRHLFEPMAAPIMAQMRSPEEIIRYLRQLSLWIFASQLGLVTVFLIHAESVAGYMGSTFALVPLVLGLILLGELSEGTTGLSELPVIFRNPRQARQNTVLALVVELTSVAILAYYYGAIGAAAGFAIGMFVLGLLRARSLKITIGKHLLTLRYVRPVCAVLVVFCANIILQWFAFSNGPLILACKIGGSALLYLLILSVFGINMSLKVSRGPL